MKPNNNKSTRDFDCGERSFALKEKGGSRRRSWFFRLTIPITWLGAAMVSWTHPGDENLLFLVSAMPAVWVTPFVPSVRLPGALPVVFAAGLGAVGLTAWLMDGLRVRRVPWLVVLVCGDAVLIWYALSSFPDLDRAIAKNGSLTAYVSAATNMSLYLSSLLFIGLALLGRGALFIVSRIGTSRRQGETP